MFSSHQINYILIVDLSDLPQVSTGIRAEVLAGLKQLRLATIKPSANRRQNGAKKADTCRCT